MVASRRQWIAAALVALVAVTSAGALRAQAPASTEPKGVDTDVPGHSDKLSEKPLPERGDASATGGLREWGQMLLALALVVALIFLARYLLRRFAGAAKISGTSQVVEVMARTSLTPKHQLFLVRMGRRALLVGCGPEGMAALVEVTEPEEIEQLLAAVEESKPTSFTDILKQKAKPARKSDRRPQVPPGASEE